MRREPVCGITKTVTTRANQAIDTDSFDRLQERWECIELRERLHTLPARYRHHDNREDAMRK